VSAIQITSHRSLDARQRRPDPLEEHTEGGLRFPALH
jgi:hypothetical protein